MELWVRSQDKENLVKMINQIGLNYANKKMIIANYQPDFIGTQGEYYEILGIYATKERALEVLDEIQCKLDYIYELSLRPRALTTIEHKIVYEMPKE